MTNEAFKWDGGGVDKERPQKISAESEKAREYRELAQKMGIDPKKRGKEEYYSEKGFASPEYVSKVEKYEGTFDDAKKMENVKAFKDNGEVNKKDSLYLVLVDFFQKIYGKDSKENRDKASKESIGFLTRLAELGVNPDYVRSGGRYKIENGYFSMSTKQDTKPIEWDMCENIPLIEESVGVIEF